jgi:molybdate transport system substrate-binding protein
MESGAAPFGVVYATDAALAPGLAVLAEFPAESHRPIRYAFAIPAGRAKPAERTLLDYAAGPEGMVVFERYSFEVVK